MDNRPRPTGMLPYSHTNERLPSSGIYNLDVSLALSRKREHPSSDTDLSSKRVPFSGGLPFSTLPSSPPLAVHESDTDNDDDCDALPKLKLANQPGIKLAASESTLRAGTSSSMTVVPGMLASRIRSQGSMSQLTPRNLIRAAVDEGRDTIELDDRDLEELPSEIEDLRHLVLLDGKTTLKICLSGNALTRLNLSLFEANVSELLLRRNHLYELPPHIGNLKNLRELSIGNNRLRYLPAEILDLPKLAIVSAYPNPWLPLPPDVANKSDPSRAFVFQQVEVFAAPTLLELSQRSLAANHTLPRDRKKWVLSQHQQRLVDAAVDARDRGNRCYHCHSPYVQPVAHVTQWWNLCNNYALPLRKHYCSLICLRADMT